MQHFRVGEDRGKCARCGAIKPLIEFMFRVDRGNYNTVCSNCRNKRQIENCARHPGRSAKYHRTWKTKNPESYKARYMRANAKQYSTPLGKLDCLTRNAVYQSIIGRRKNRHTYNALGYSLHELKVHLERQFLPGMSWNNYGTWHLDHIIPLASFKIESDGDYPFDKPNRSM